jgi:Niemann-Pick C1 protein
LIPNTPSTIPPPNPTPNQQKKTAPYAAPDGAASNATLAGVCFKPFGEDCATQSVLQYWRMDRAFYEAEMAKGPYSAARLTPDYCFGHW